MRVGAVEKFKSTTNESCEQYTIANMQFDMFFLFRKTCCYVASKRKTGTDLDSVCIYSIMLSAFWFLPGHVSSL